MEHTPNDIAGDSITREYRTFVYNNSQYLLHKMTLGFNVLEPSEDILFNVVLVIYCDKNEHNFLCPSPDFDARLTTPMHHAPYLYLWRKLNVAPSVYKLIQNRLQNRNSILNCEHFYFFDFCIRNLALSVIKIRLRLWKMK